jgi:hypothetical protein
MDDDLIQRNLKEVGIEATLDGVQRPRFAEMASLGKGWEGIIRMQAFTRPDALVQIAGFASKGANEFSEVVRRAGSHGFLRPGERGLTLPQRRSSPRN